MKKVLALLLCAVLAAGLFAGCSEKTETAAPSPAETPAAAPVQTGSPAPSAAEDPTARKTAPEAYADDLVLFTLDGNDVTWKEFYPWVRLSLWSHESAYGQIDDLSEAISEDSDATYGDYFAARAVSTMRYYKGLESHCAAIGVRLTEADAEKVENSIAEQKAQYESEEEFNRAVLNQFGTMELYRYMLEMTQLYDRCFESLFGENGSKTEDSDVLDYAAANDYMMAKHILLMTVDGTGAALPDEEKAEILAEAEELVRQLDGKETQEEKLALFDELMNEKSEDPGLQRAPNGYLFRKGQMNQNFENAVLGLGENEYTGPVESSSGYHIILRLPIDPDETPTEYGQYKAYGIEYPLRLIAAESLFTDIVSGWVTDTPLSPAEAYNELDLSLVFPA